MKKLLLSIVSATTLTLFAGNPDRVGQAGAPELLVNPWARSAGLAGINFTRLSGSESIMSNVGCLALTKGTEVNFSHSLIMKGSDTKISALGIAQRLGENGGVLGVGLMSVNYGEIEKTTVDVPENSNIFFKPRVTNINVSYARSFTQSIHGGLTAKLINQGIDNVSATGFALDAGITYITGKTDNIRFAISLRNIGTPMRYKGDGLSHKGPYGNVTGVNLFVEGQQFDLPAQLNIGGSYDFNFDEKTRLTVLGAFTSNSFSKDRFGLGLEFGALKDMIQARVGYNYEDNILSAEKSTTIDGGLRAGLTLQVPFGKDKESKIAFDYAYRTTRIYNGTHSFGLRINL